MIKKRTRLYNWLIDTGCCLICFLTAIRFIYLSPPNDLQLHLLRYYFLLVNFCYYLIFESITGQTLGKRLTHTAVYRQNNHKPSFTQILLRSFVRFIPFEALGIFFSGDNNLLHDIFSKTKLLKTNNKHFTQFL